MSTDKKIQSDVIEELGNDPVLDAAEIGVAVNNGVVTLSGNVNSYFKKISAERAAQRVKDVRAVAVDLEVRLGTEHQRNDTEIAATVINALKWSSTVPDEGIKVTVDNGWVTLEGKVNWQYQKQAAAHAVEDLTGVRGVNNLINIEPAIKAAAVKDNIRKALERNADVEASRINIETEGQMVILKGNVNSWNERSIVERAAWSSPGVSVVRDNLTVSSWN